MTKGISGIENNLVAPGDMRTTRYLRNHRLKRPEIGVLDDPAGKPAADEAFDDDLLPDTDLAAGAVSMPMAVSGSITGTIPVSTATVAMAMMPWPHIEE